VSGRKLKGASFGEWLEQGKVILERWRGAKNGFACPRKEGGKKGGVLQYHHQGISGETRGVLDIIGKGLCGDVEDVHSSVRGQRRRVGNHG